MGTQTEVAFGPEIIVESFKPVLDTAIEEIRTLLPKQPRQVTFQTISLGTGGFARAVGFDASRTAVTFAMLSQTQPMGLAYSEGVASDMAAYYKSQSSASIVNPPGAYFLFTTWNITVTLHTQAPVWLFSAAPGDQTGSSITSICSESFALS